MNINELYLKNEIFDLFENARVLFNEYYNGKDNYNKDDLKAIFDLMLKIENNVYEVKNEIRSEI